MIDLIGTLRRLTATMVVAGTALTFVYNEVAGLDGDAMRGTDDATLQAIWTDALATALAYYTEARASYLDELDFDLLAALTTIAGYVNDTLENTAINHHWFDGRARVYPQVPSAAPAITTAAPADTFGSWTEVVPIDTIDMEYSPVAFMVEQSNGTATYIIQFGFSTAGGSDPTTAQIVGEQRFVVVGVPLKIYHADLELKGMECPVNAKLWARLMSSSTNADTCDISIVVERHYSVNGELGHTATWPWAS